jgi:hypothetical protein
MQKMVQFELNEVNFDFVRRYGQQGELPRLNALVSAHGLTETQSERDYHDLEPWIQWVTAHTGKSLDEHGVFRLGDIVEHTGLDQVWEVLERDGMTVGAISPMNARNACTSPAFFMPDPWTRSAVSGPALLAKVYQAAAQIVNDNAQSKVAKSSLGWLLTALARYAAPVNYALYAKMIARSRSRPWSRAMVLDALLADIFLSLWKRGRPDYSTIFLNAAAHIQHHYMFNASVYDGPQRNPDWYVAEGVDPVLDVYRLYDRIVGRFRDALPDARIIIATGLHQNPYPTTLYYWRLTDHDRFLRTIDLKFDRVEPRMSRDFVVYCQDTASALRAERLLSQISASDGTALFEVDNRGASLFVMLVYPRDIGADLQVIRGSRAFGPLGQYVTFVAIKNGEHDGTGYLIDTARDKRTADRAIPLASLYDRTLDHFGVKRASV